MTRLNVISSYISEGDKVIDVGCDMALLSKLLAKRNIYSIASDINQNIINRAYDSTSDYLKKYIDFRVGNGITLKNNEINFIVVISGMGTHNILNIIKNDKNDYKKIITLSNNKYYELRKGMSSLGYKIIEEEIIKERNKYYNLIVFTKGISKLSEEDLIIGISHNNKALLKEYNEFLIKKYYEILNKYNNEKLVNVINILKNYKY